MFPQNHQYRFSSSYYNQMNQKQQPLYYFEETNNFTKSDRRQWDKSNPDFNMEYPDPEKIAANQKRYDDYLFNLQINNRIQKIVSQKDEKEEKLEKLESGFSLYVNGAHQKNERYTPRHTITKSSSENKKSNQNIKSRINCHKLDVDNLKQFDMLVAKQKKLDEKSAAKKNTVRKKWSVNSSFILKTEDGYEIKINSPTKYTKSKPNVSKSDITETAKKNDYYSDDFVSDSDNEITDNNPKNNEDYKNLIESVQFSDIETDSSKSVEDEQIYEQIEEDIDEDTVDDKLPRLDNKKIILNLNKTDIKNLRESIHILNQDNNANQYEFKNSFEDLSSKIDTNKLKIVEKDDKQIQNENRDSFTDNSSICDLIIKKAAHLNPKDRYNLVTFLNRIDKHWHKSKT